MLLHFQTWFPLFTIVLSTAICLSVASFIMGREKALP
jgi:hypothetical protein